VIGKIYNYSSYVVSVSHGVQDFLLTSYNLKDGLLKVVHNPFDIDDIKTKAREEVEPNLKEVFSDFRTIISVGRLTKQKGHIHLIRIFAKLVKECGHKYKLLLLGDGPDKGKILEQTRDLGLKACTEDDLNQSADVFLLGFRNNPYKYIAYSDLFLSTSLWEGLPSVIIESMACGTPVIHSDCPSGPKEILTDFMSQNENPEPYLKKYGILLPPYNTNDQTGYDELDNLYLKHIIMLFEDDDIKAEYASKGEFHSREFSYHKIKDKWKHLINN